MVSRPEEFGSQQPAKRPGSQESPCKWRDGDNQTIEDQSKAEHFENFLQELFGYPPSRYRSPFDEERSTTEGLGVFSSHGIEEVPSECCPKATDNSRFGQLQEEVNISCSRQGSLGLPVQKVITPDRINRNSLSSKKRRLPASETPDDDDLTTTLNRECRKLSLRGPSHTTGRKRNRIHAPVIVFSRNLSSRITFLMQKGQPDSAMHSPDLVTPCDGAQGRPCETPGTLQTTENKNNRQILSDQSFSGAPSSTGYDELQDILSFMKEEWPDPSTSTEDSFLHYPPVLETSPGPPAKDLCPDIDILP